MLFITEVLNGLNICGEVVGGCEFFMWLNDFKAIYCSEFMNEVNIVVSLSYLHILYFCIVIISGYIVSHLFVCVIGP